MAIIEVKSAPVIGEGRRREASQKKTKELIERERRKPTVLS